MNIVGKMYWMSIKLIKCGNCIVVFKENILILRRCLKYLGSWNVQLSLKWFSKITHIYIHTPCIHTHMYVRERKCSKMFTVGESGIWVISLLFLQLKVWIFSNQNNVRYSATGMQDKCIQNNCNSKSIEKGCWIISFCVWDPKDEIHWWKVSHDSEE